MLAEITRSNEPSESDDARALRRASRGVINHLLAALYAAKFLLAYVACIDTSC